MVKKLLGIFIVISLCACKSATFDTKLANYSLEDLEYDMYRYVKMYYCQYLTFPSLEELYSYCWDITNSVNGYQYPSFFEYEKAGIRNTNAAGAESFNQFLFYNKNNLTFQEKGEILRILWKKKGLFEMHFDYCEMKNDISNLHQFSNYYNSSGVASLIDFDVVDSIYSFERNLLKKYHLDQHPLQKREKLLLRYNINDGYRSLCYTNLDISKNKFLRDLKCVLDTFLLNKNVEMMQLILSVSN